MNKLARTGLAVAVTMFLSSPLAIAGNAVDTTVDQTTVQNVQPASRATPADSVQSWLMVHNDVAATAAFAQQARDPHSGVVANTHTSVDTIAVHGNNVAAMAAFAQQASNPRSGIVLTMHQASHPHAVHANNVAAKAAFEQQARDPHSGLITQAQKVGSVNAGHVALGVMSVDAPQS